MFGFFNKKKATVQTSNGSIAAYAILSEFLRDGLKAGHIHLNSDFWLWADKNMSSDVKNLCSDLIERMRVSVLLLEADEMKNLSLVDLERLATALFENEKKNKK